MSRDEQERLRDIQDAIVAIREHLALAGETSADKEDPLLHDALLFQFVVIGEAVKHLAPATRVNPRHSEAIPVISALVPEMERDERRSQLIPRAIRPSRACRDFHEG
jgi:uncharacterized protein with HEPN domain